MKLSFVLFDEIEKASDALWNLLLGILDKATLTLGDNRRVDFSRALIFMTSNLGAAEMSSILRPNLGFAAGEAERNRADGMVDEKIERQDLPRGRGSGAAQVHAGVHEPHRQDGGVPAAGRCELRKILTMELNMVQQRIFSAANAAPFVFTLTDDGQGLPAARRHRHEIRRAPPEAGHRPTWCIRFEPDRDRAGARRRPDPRGFRRGAAALTFFKDAEDMPAYVMARMVDTFACAPAHDVWPAEPVAQPTACA